MDTTRQSYPSDVSDTEWDFLIPYLTLMRADAPQRSNDLHEVYDALRYVVKTGCQWERLPQDFPPHQTVCDHFRRRHPRGVWEKINRLVNETSRQKKGGTPRRVICSLIPKV